MDLPDLSVFYIDGAWVAPAASATVPVVDPATEEAFGTLAMGGKDDVD